MASTFNPYGFKAIGFATGGTPPRMLTAIPGGISAAYSTSIYENQPVLLNDGVLNPVTSAADAIGVFVGVQYTPTSGNIPIWNNWWTASTPFVAGSLTAFLTQDFGSVLYRVQADGPVSSTAIGDQADESNFTSGSSATGLSGSSLSSTLKGAGVQGMFRIVGLWDSPDNAWYDVDPIAGAYPELVVQLARNQYISNKVAI